MSKISIHFPLKGLRIDPDVFEHLEIDEKAIQTLASLFGWDGEARRLITCSLRGSLHTISPTAKAIMNITGVGANDLVTFNDTPTSEVMVMAKNVNAGDVWVNIGAVAETNVGWPLTPGDVVIMSLNNLHDLQILIRSDGDKVIILRTV